MSFYDARDFIAIKNQIDEFFATDSWHDFCMSLSNESQTMKTDSLIITVSREIRDGKINPSTIFKTIKVTSLVDSFILHPDQEFLNIAFHLLINLKDNSPLPFIECLIEKAPQTIIKMISQTQTEIFTQFIGLLIFSYFRKPSSIISENLVKYPLQVVIRQFFVDVSVKSAQTMNIKNVISLLIDIWKYSNKNKNLQMFYSSIQNETSVAFEYQYDPIVIVILDFLEFGYKEKIFDYSTEFGSIFGQCASQYFVAVLLERMNQTEDAIIQTQIELIDRNASQPLREALRSKSNQNGLKPLRTFSDSELIAISNQYKQKKTLPAIIVQLNMFDKDSLVNSVAPSLRNLSKSNPACKELVETLENKKMIPVLKKSANWEAVISTLRDTDNTIGKFANVSHKAPMNDFAAKFFDSFNKALYLRHSKDIKNFFKLVSTQFIKKLDDINEFTRVVVEFLKGELIAQHRKSLSIIALSCPLHSFIESDIFGHKREIELLLNLHEAAIACCETLSSDCNSNATFFDPLLVLRLRWRCLRGDCSSNICWLPEFVSLADNNILKFLRWEATTVSPDSTKKRMKILSSLGIFSSISNTPSLIRELLSISDPSSILLEALLPFLRNCPIEKVVLPENLNVNVLFKIDSILWSKQVMNHPTVLEILRENPDPSISQALLISCGNNTENFEKFPIGFYALLVNVQKLIGERPPILDHMETLLENIDYGEIDESIPYYAKISIIAYLAKRNRNLNRLFGANESFAKLCVFFTICYHKFHESVHFLNLNQLVIKILIIGMPYAIAFVGANCWESSLIEFAFYCASNYIAYESDDWIRFIAHVKGVNWPSHITEDNSKLILFNEYSKSTGLE